MSEILGVGGVCVDRLGTIPRIPDWDETEYIANYTMQQGGIVATAMVAAARLGESVEFIGGIGDDDAGRYVLDTFQKAQVKADLINVFHAEHTAFSFVLVHAVSGKRTIIHHKGVQNRPLLSLPPLNLSGITFLHLDGFWFETALEIARQAKTQGITITLDPSSKLLQDPHADALFHLIDYFMPSYAFAKGLTGESEPLKAADKILKYGAQAVIITRGEEGCFLRTPTDYEQIPAFQVPVVDTTGAGDTFHGAFVAGLSKGYDVYQAARFASAVAALKCTKLGGQSGIPTFQETQAFLRERGVQL